MTILLLCGLVATIALVRFVFSLATMALPASIGIALGLSLRSAGCAPGTSLLLSLLAATAALGLGSAAFRAARTPLVRMLVAMIFVLPAAVAGYGLGQAISALVLDQQIVARALGLLCAIAAAQAAHRTLQRASPV